jgi:NADPH:quinone reductase
MRAARIAELGKLPRLEKIDAPTPAGGQVAVEVAAVALNPLDVAVAAGRFYGGHPPLPYTPGSEAAGRLEGGERVYVFGDGLGTRRDGTLAERTVVPDDLPVAVRDGVDDTLAVAYGIAGMAGWLAATERARIGEGDRVLVLAATGAVGSVALQAARLRGAARVVAAGRNEERLARALELGADEIVRLDDRESLAEELASACGGEGPTVVIDPLWGPPVAAAVVAAAPGARVVNVGASAGPEATLPSGAVRGKQLEIRGHSNFAVPRDAFRAAYSELLSHAAAGRIRLDVERLPLERVAEAWERQAAGTSAKLVVTV